MNWQNYPLIRLVIPFILGMAVAHLYASRMDLMVLFIFCCTLLSLLFFLMKKTEEEYLSAKFSIVAATLSFAVGMSLYVHKYQSIAQGVPQDSMVCNGVLSELPQEKAHSWALNLQQENGTHILLYIGKDKRGETNNTARLDRLDVGDTVFANIKHLDATGDGKDSTFAPYHKYLFSQGICATCYATNSQWNVHPRKTTASLSHSAKMFQHKLHNIYNERGINGESGDVIEAMTIGMKSKLDKNTRQKYAAAGTSHMLAMSGLHVGLIAMVLQFFFVTSAMPYGWMWLCNICIIVILWCFAIVTGMSPSIVRATLMFTILMLCQSVSHELLPLNSCALAIAIMLCINPLYINDAGFQLSFVSVGSIGLAGTLASSDYPPQPRILRFLKGIVYISFICAIATAPLVAYHFGRIPLLSVMSNIVITPFVYIIMWGSILWWVFLWFMPVNTLLTSVLNMAADTMNSIAERISSVPYASVEWHPSAFATVLCYIQLLIIIYIIKRTKKIRLTNDTRRPLG